MKNRLKSVLALLSAIILLGACQKDSLSGGQLSYVFKPTNLAASVGTTTAASGLVVAANSNGSMTWTSGTLNVQKVQLSAKKDQVATSFEYSNLTNIDILNTGTVSGSVSLPDGTYDAIEIKLNLVQSNTNVPLVLKGTYTETSGTKIPVEVQFNEAYDLKLNPPQLVIKGDKYTANVTLDLTKMMTGLVANDLGQTTRTQPNNTILVTSSINAALYAKLKANLLLVPSVLIAK
ncbi:MAG TPA: hypothetical protein DIT07_05255 [Sphingobacteriaceae bacterium]|nr:hypothetical protein [Sphingobacteriaceae bacterium]